MLCHLCAKTLTTNNVTTNMYYHVLLHFVSGISGPRGYKTFFMLNSVEHKILNAHKYKKNQEIQHFLGSDKSRMLFFLLKNVKMPTFVGILTFLSRKNFMLS